jgi:uncharacterized phage-associated protein
LISCIHNTKLNFSKKSASFAVLGCIAMTIEYKLNPQKAVEVVAMFLKLHGDKPMFYLGLMKLLYMAEKLSLQKFDTPVIGDRYVSMDKGPVLSGVYDLIKGKPLSDNPKALKIWTKYISPRNRTWEIKLVKDPSNDELCVNDENVIREIYAKKGAISRFDLVEYTHQFSEWRDPHGSSIPIRIEEILNDLNKTEAQIKLVESDIYRENYLIRIVNYA